MAARGGMALRLGHFNHVDDGWNMVTAGGIGRFLVRFPQRGIIPPFDGVNIKPLLAVWLPLEPFEQFR